MSLTLRRYDITFENILKQTIITYIQVIVHKLCRSKSSKMKLTDLHYINDKNYSDSKLCQIFIIIKILEIIMYMNYFLVIFKFWKRNAPI